MLNNYLNIIKIKEGAAVQTDGELRRMFPMIKDAWFLYVCKDEIYLQLYILKDMYYGKLVCLRALEESDLEDVLKFYNEWTLRRWAGVPLPKSRKAIEQWLEQVSVSQPWKDGSVHFAVTDKKSERFLGIIRFYDIKTPHMRASIGISLTNPEEYSKGYGTDCVRTMLWFGFHVLGLHSIYLDTMEHNARAIRVAEKVGFKKIGMFRETEFIEGQFKGLVYMDILRDEFLKEFPPGTKTGDPL